MWIPVARVASTSMAIALNGKGKQCPEMFAFVRHPFDRVCSALSLLAPGVPIDEAYAEHRGNPHLKSQSEILAPFLDRLDFLGLYDRLDDDWEWVRERLQVGPLPKTHVTAHRHDWRAHDWKNYLPRYERDFELCRAW